MTFGVCVYPETASEVLARTGPDVALELQSFGLKGVRSPEAWDERAEFYARFVAEARASAENRGRIFHLHGPFFDLPYHSPDCLIRDAVRRRLDDTLRLCERIAPVNLVMHLNCPRYFCRPDRAARWAAPAAEFWRPWASRLAGLGVRPVFENVDEPDPSAGLAFAAELAEFGVALCLDVGHAKAFSPTSPMEWAARAGASILHFHLHDNAGDDDSHLAPGAGAIDFPSLIPAVVRGSPEACLSLEVETGAAESLRGLDYVRGLAGR